MTVPPPGAVLGRRYPAAAFFAALDGLLTRQLDGHPLWYALFTCSDEVNSRVGAARQRQFGDPHGIFTTRVIGAQVFAQQVAVAAHSGHASNVYEINIHLSLAVAGDSDCYREVIGRDGVRRAFCGALGHILNDFRKHAAGPTAARLTDPGDLDLLGTLAARLLPDRDAILSAVDPFFAITHRHLEVQVASLAQLLRRMNDLSRSDIVLGTITWNRTEDPDLVSLELSIRV